MHTSAPRIPPLTLVWLQKKAQKPPKQPSVPEKQPGPAPPAADLSLQPTSRNGQNSRRRSESEEIQEVPEVINQRLLNRMLTFSLIPVFLGFVSLPLLAYIQVIRMLTFSRIPVFLGFVSLTLLAYIQVSCQLVGLWILLLARQGR